MANVRVGLLLPSRETLLWADSNLASIVASARSAEKAGFDSVWVGDSLLARPRGEPLLLLAAVAGATSRVTLGTAVLLPLLRHPVTLAHALATLDRIAEGRLIIGVGPGAELPGTHAELRTLGVPSDHRVGAMLETLERCRRLWRGDERDVQLQPRPLSPAGPPIWVGATGPRMLRETARKFEGWLPFSPTPSAYATALATLRQEAERAGRDPDGIARGLYLTVAIADKPEAAPKMLDEYVRAYYGVPAEVMARAQAMHAGTIESASEWFAAYERAGAQHIVIRPALPGLEGFDTLARELLGAARGL